MLNLGINAAPLSNGFDLNLGPVKRVIALDMLGGIFGMVIRPSDVFHLSTFNKTVVLGWTFPRACVSSRRIGEDILDGRRREVVISLYHLGFVRAGQLEGILFKDSNVGGHFVLAGTVLVKSDEIEIIECGRKMQHRFVTLWGRGIRRDRTWSYMVAQCAKSPRSHCQCIIRDGFMR